MAKTGRTSSSSSTSSDSNNVKSTGAYRGRPFRRLLDVEFQERAEKGLCYRCDGKFSPGHICPNKQFQVLILGEGQDEEDENEEEARHEKQFQSIQLSLYSMSGLISGLTSKKSIRLWGKIDEKSHCISGLRGLS